jgi:hypothetical protein
MQELVGKTIVSIKYMSKLHSHTWGWNKRAVIITLDDGTRLIPMMDDEGNDAGSIQVMKWDKETLMPTL